LARSSTWAAGLTYRPLDVPATDALELFRFAGAWVPARETVEAGWGAWSDATLVGAVLVERSGTVGLIHGPVVVAPAAGSEAPEPGAALEAAGALVDAVIRHAGLRRIETLFARPQGLDRIWVRLGFIPVPEVELPEALRGRPGAGLYGWRGGSALWSAAGRGAGRAGLAER
jgi:hypothetical protein